jgi:glycerol-3-phosphate O-acyltransferase
MSAMDKEKREIPANEGRTPGRWISRWLDGSLDHYDCLIPEDIGNFTRLLLRLFYLGIKVDKTQIELLRQLPQDAVVVYVTKFKNYFEYLFYYNRYRREHLPFPQIGFDYKIYLCQPVSRLVKILLARLESILRYRSLPNPYTSGYIKQELLNGRSGFLSLVGRKSFYRRFVKAHTDPVQYLIEMQKAIERPVYLVPQLIFFSKTARREDPTLLDILFGPEDKPGRIRRLYTLFRNPGKVFVEVSEPVDLKLYLQSDKLRHQSSEYQSLVLRRDLLLQLNRHRQSITGPVRKSKQELKESILTRDRLRQFMKTHAANRKVPIHEIHRQADAYLEEIAANYRPAFIKIGAVIVGWIIRTMFDGVTINHDVLGRVKGMARKGPLVLIPCHKSHIDYLILDYILYHNNMAVPHIAAGKNLSFWPMGPLFRAGGAFFLRRSFGGAVLYSKVFAEYIYKLLEEGYNIEQFIEGGRSRTGKLLMPKLGLLSILINAYKDGACNDMIFVPIYIGYDRIVEEKSYLHELGGGQKETENLWQVIRARKLLKKRYGKIYIQFHDPFSMNHLLSTQERLLAEMKPKEVNSLIRKLGYRIINAINRVTVVTPHAIVAGAILNVSKDSFSFSQLQAVNDIYLKHLKAQNIKLSDTLASEHERAFEQVLDIYCQRKFVEILPQSKAGSQTERQFTINETRRLYLEYYKNNCVAFFVPAAYTAMAILEQNAFRFSASDLHAGYAFWQDFFAYEFAYDVDSSPEYNVRKSIKAFIDSGIVNPHPTLPDTYDITPAGLRQLNLFALFLKTFLESYWIVLSHYIRNSQEAIKTKDRLKEIAARGNRMYKRKEVERKEALSKVSYQNAVEFFASKGIKGSEDSAKIEVYAEAIQKALKLIQP